MSDDSDDLCAIYVDMGTTNTRVWLMRGADILARAGKQAGVRDSARDGSTTRIQSTLKELIATVQEQIRDNSPSTSPAFVAGAGMVSSALGLAEVPHIPAPADLSAIADATQSFRFPEITGLPFLLVPGVRTGLESAGFASLDQDDVMRGEETLCIGLQALGLVEAPGVVLNLGSHWKAVQINAGGRIQSSVTSLSGELIETVRTQTILAGAVGNTWPDTLSPEWFEAGMHEQRRAGLSRALFCVRLLELKNQGADNDRFSFLLGAFVASDLDSLLTRRTFNGDTQVVISGQGLIASAWAYAFRLVSIHAIVLSEQQTERAFLAGLSGICAQAAGKTWTRDIGETSAVVS